jgi:hypothetical protein
MRMRRFGQVIRHGGHFGKPRLHLHPNHQIRGDSPLDSKQCFRGEENSSRQNHRVRTMIGLDSNLRSHRILTMFFAFIFGISAVSTAVVPGILHI